MCQDSVLAKKRTKILNESLNDKPENKGEMVLFANVQFAIEDVKNEKEKRFGVHYIGSDKRVTCLFDISLEKV